MGSWTGSWLSGPSSVGTGRTAARQQRPGSRLGLPADGTSSVASLARRLLAFVLDAAVANTIVGVGYLAGARPDPALRGLGVNLVFLLEEFVLVAAFGATVGMRLVGIRVIRLRAVRNAQGTIVRGPGTGPDEPRPDDRVPVGLVAVRTVLLALLVPALIWDADKRALHDRAGDAAVVRA